MTAVSTGAARRLPSRPTSSSTPRPCEFVKRDRYQRFVAVRFRADGREVNRWLVENGNAVDWGRYSKGAYRDFQEFAPARGIGIWRGKIELPCRARAEHAKRETSC